MTITVKKMKIKEIDKCDAINFIKCFSDLFDTLKIVNRITLMTIDNSHLSVEEFYDNGKESNAILILTDPLSHESIGRLNIKFKKLTKMDSFTITLDNDFFKKYGTALYTSYSLVHINCILSSYKANFEMMDYCVYYFLYNKPEYPYRLILMHDSANNLTIPCKEKKISVGQDYSYPERTIIEEAIDKDSGKSILYISEVNILLILLYLNNLPLYQSVFPEFKGCHPLANKVEIPEIKKCLNLVEMALL